MASSAPADRASQSRRHSASVTAASCCPDPGTTAQWLTGALSLARPTCGCCSLLTVQPTRTPDEVARSRPLVRWVEVVAAAAPVRGGMGYSPPVEEKHAPGSKATVVQCAPGAPPPPAWRHVQSGVLGWRVSQTHAPGSSEQPAASNAPWEVPGSTARQLKRCPGLLPGQRSTGPVDGGARGSNREQPGALPTVAMTWLPPAAARCPPPPVPTKRTAAKEVQLPPGWRKEAEKPSLSRAAVASAPARVANTTSWVAASLSRDVTAHSLVAAASSQTSGGE